MLALADLGNGSLIYARHDFMPLKQLFEHPEKFYKYLEAVSRALTEDIINMTGFQIKEIKWKLHEPLYLRGQSLPTGGYVWGSYH